MPRTKTIVDILIPIVGVTPLKVLRFGCCGHGCCHPRPVSRKQHEAIRLAVEMKKRWPHE
jgi:hypothetical protein